MDVKGIGAGVVAPKKQETREQQAVKRVQTEFLKQVSQGKSEKSALLSSLKALDEKYNPKEDTLHISKANIGEEKLGTASDFHCYAKSFKMPSAETVGKWLNIIAQVTPLLIKILDILFPEKGDTKAETPKAATVNMTA